MAAYSLRLDLAKKVNRHFLKNNYGDLSFLGSYALHTDPIVRGNLVSVSVCHFEDEKTRDTKTSGM